MVAKVISSGLGTAWKTVQEDRKDPGNLRQKNWLCGAYGSLVWPKANGQAWF